MHTHKCVTVPCKNRLFHHILLASPHSKCCIAELSLRWKHTCFKGEGTHLQRCRISPCNLATPLKEVGQHSDGCNQSTRRLIFKLCTRLQHIHVVHRQFDCFVIFIKWVIAIGIKFLGLLVVSFGWVCCTCSCRVCGAAGWEVWRHSAVYHLQRISWGLCERRGLPFGPQECCGNRTEQGKL